jgi:thiosulfate reductase/polysulfide reductase chain A
LMSAVDKPKAGGFPFADEGLASGLLDATFPGTATADLKAWMVYGSNLLQSLPSPSRTLEAIGHLDFLVAIDVLPAEICGWADVVLPECSYLERADDLWAPAYKQPFVSLRQPVVEPLGDSKPGSWIARELGRRLGLEPFFPWKDALDVAETRVKAAGLDWAKLRETGVLLGPRPPSCEEEGLTLAIETESGKIELYSKALEQAGFDPLPRFTPPEEPPAGMFRLLFGRAPMHTFGRTTNNRLLSTVMDENELWLNVGVAADLLGFQSKPLRSGDKVVLVNQADVRSGPIKVKLTERIRGDCVYMVHGYGHTAKGLSFARGRGASDSDLVSRVKVDPIMGGTGMNGNFVRLERAEARA